LAAANCYKKEHFDSTEIQEVIKNAQFFYVTGFFLTVSVDTIIALGKHAAQTNKLFSFNVSAAFIVDFFHAQLMSVLPYADILFGNDDEFRSLGKKNDWGDDLKVIAKHTSELPKENSQRKRVVVITRGCQPTYVYDPTTSTVIEIEVKLVPQEEIVDVNGAGDSFVGGFLSQLVLGKSLEQCVHAGNYCAGVTIRTSGTDFSGKTPDFHC